MTNSTLTEPRTRSRDTRPEPGCVRRSVGGLGIDRFSGLYLIGILVVAFSLWMPATFATATNARTILAGSVVSGVIALGATISLVSGAFDVSIGANMSFSISLVAWLQSEHNVNAGLAVMLTLAAGALIGAVNAFVITQLKVDAVIATLGMSSLLAAFSFWIVAGRTIISGISPRFTQFGSAKFVTIPVPVFYLVGLSVALWYLLEFTPVGRKLIATGSSPEAARLAGLSVVGLKTGALMLTGTLSALAGVILTMQLGAASFNAGVSYLLPAYAAAFLGSTQIRPGRFNVAGTLVALYLLAIGVKGLQLQYPSLPWIADLFQGLALIIAVALGVVAGRRRTRRT